MQYISKLFACAKKISVYLPNLFHFQITSLNQRKKIDKILHNTTTDVERKKLCEEVLKPYMGETTLKCFLNGKDGNFAKPRQWTHDEIVFAITLRTISKKAYNLIRDRKVYPLPCESTLKRSYADFQTDEGRAHSIILIFVGQQSTLEQIILWRFSHCQNFKIKYIFR